MGGSVLLNKSIINSINGRYTARVEELIRYNIPLDEKKAKIIDISEEYFVEVGEQLPSPLLYQLTEWFLHETLSVKNVDKVSRTEYPVLSLHQIKRRDRKQVSVVSDTLDYLNITRGRESKKKTREKER